MKAVAILLFAAACFSTFAQNVFVHGDLRQWHKVTLTVEGPQASEKDNDPNPFLDYRFEVIFRHESGSPEYTVPGYFAADGNAGHSSATSGKHWRVHLSPDKVGVWNYTLRFKKGKNAAIDDDAKTESVLPIHRRTGKFTVTASNKKDRDFRGKGRLEYVGEHYLKFAGDGEYFLKVGADSPESLLAYADFDGTEARTNAVQRVGEAAPTALHKYEPHKKDWKDGDPSWKDGKGKGLVGGLNYLAGKGVNAFSLLTYNAGGDGDNVWPFIAREDKLHFDCSKLDQWGIVFDHAQKLGLYLHFKLQETEMDDSRIGPGRTNKTVLPALDGGALGRERKLYLREMIARYGYLLALNWNLGEENTQSTAEQRAMAKYIHDLDPYKHNIVLHTYPQEQDRVYAPLLGTNSVLTGLSLQNDWGIVHQQTLKWVKASAKAERPWVVANDEQGPADLGVPPDIGYQRHSGEAKTDRGVYTMHDIRKQVLWGNLLAGGAGVEYYFGYKLPQNDLGCEDWRSRDKTWDYGRIALEFFEKGKIPFWEMKSADDLVTDAVGKEKPFCFAKEGLYLVYLQNGGSAVLKVRDQSGYSIELYNPREGGALKKVAVQLRDNRLVLESPAEGANEDWLFVVKKTVAAIERR
ncbi:MAG TPA: DUF5060 domain-containing protein [Verrucomicrobiae bacterium]